MKKILILGAATILLAACSGTASESRNSISPQTSTTSTTDPNNPLGCPEDGIDYGCPTEPLDIAPDIPADGLSASCEQVRDTKPEKVKYDAWDAPGVVTTDIEIDRQGNKFISGYLSDEQDFNYKDSFSTVGVDGWGFQFFAKFNPQSEFEWIQCLRASSLNHWYKGPVVDTDSNGFIYVCDSTLERWTTTGELVWSSKTLRWDSEDSSDATRNCATSSDGFTVVTGVDESYFVSPEGKILWKKDLGWNSAATFLASGNILMGSNSSTSIINRKGELVWRSERPHRDDLGPNGLTDGAFFNTYATDQTGLVATNDGVVVASTINKRTDFDPSSSTFFFKPRWIQEIVIAEYSLKGILQWATKVQPPSTGPDNKNAQYFEVFDSIQGNSGELFVYGGGTSSRESQPMRLFVAKFSSSGKQLRFLWLEEYTSFIHNMGRYIEVDSRGRLYGTGEGLRVPPFIWSRDL